MLTCVYASCTGALEMSQLRVAPSQKKLAPREARNQGCIERQYSPTPLKFSEKKKFEARIPAWVTYSDTPNKLTAIGDSWVLKVPSLFPFANVLAAPSLQTSSSSPSSPKVLNPPKLPVEIPADGSPKADSPETGSGVPSTLKGGCDPSASLERKPSLKKTAAT
jgi:hypothetical protein